MTITVCCYVFSAKHKIAAFCRCSQTERLVIKMAQNQYVLLRWKMAGVIKAELYPQVAPNTVKQLYQPGKEGIL